ncbi:MAG TPA: CPBP family intramembrane glutamic endopeptidase [Steroidobacteraceae bacterium]|jgi:membrane protease YdiL (CAAX protease family)|nr:CPBP family intramembrane glutamic endopeptidase [Steroidobacteraceae bacterium]
MYLYLVAIFSPHVSAATVTAVERGRLGLKAFYDLVFRRISATWILIAITVPVIIYLLPYLSAIATGQAHGSPVHPPPRTLPMLILGQLAVAIGEEPGWRGFALPRLTQHLGPLAGTLALGIAWVLWHLPLFVMPGSAQYGTAFTPFLLTLLAWSLVVTFMMTRAGGSVLVAMLFHFSANVCDFTMWQAALWQWNVAPWLVAAVLAVILIRNSRFATTSQRG